MQSQSELEENLPKKQQYSKQNEIILPDQTCLTLLINKKLKKYSDFIQDIQRKFYPEFFKGNQSILSQSWNLTIQEVIFNLNDHFKAQNFNDFILYLTNNLNELEQANNPQNQQLEQLIQKEIEQIDQNQEFETKYLQLKKEYQSFEYNYQKHLQFIEQLEEVIQINEIEQQLKQILEQTKQQEQFIQSQELLIKQLKNEILVIKDQIELKMPQLQQKQQIQQLNQLQEQLDFNKSIITSSQWQDEEKIDQSNVNYQLQIYQIQEQPEEKIEILQQQLCQIQQFVKSIIVQSIYFQNNAQSKTQQSKPQAEEQIIKNFKEYDQNQSIKNNDQQFESQIITEQPFPQYSSEKQQMNQQYTNSSILSQIKPEETQQNIDRSETASKIGIIKPIQNSDQQSELQLNSQIQTQQFEQLQQKQDPEIINQFQLFQQDSLTTDTKSQIKIIKSTQNNGQNSEFQLSSKSEQFSPIQQQVNNQLQYQNSNIASQQDYQNSQNQYQQINYQPEYKQQNIFATDTKSQIKIIKSTQNNGQNSEFQLSSKSEQFSPIQQQVNNQLQYQNSNIASQQDYQNSQNQYQQINYQPEYKQQNIFATDTKSQIKIIKSTQNNGQNSEFQLSSKSEQFSPIQQQVNNQLQYQYSNIASQQDYQNSQNQYQQINYQPEYKQQNIFATDTKSKIKIVKSTQNNGQNSQQQIFNSQQIYSPVSSEQNYQNQNNTEKQQNQFNGNNVQQSLNQTSQIDQNSQFICNKIPDELKDDYGEVLEDQYQECVYCKLKTLSYYLTPCCHAYHDECIGKLIKEAKIDTQMKCYLCTKSIHEGLQHYGYLTQSQLQQ